MNDTIHFFDLDGTLWSIKTNAWIIDTRKPGVPILKLRDSELKLILAGVYINEEIYIEYNGETYWIGKKLLDRIKKFKPNIKEEYLGLSFYEKLDPKFYDNLKIYKENIRHLVEGEKCDIGILSARYSDEKDTLLLTTLKKELEDIGLDIDKFYYVNDYYKPMNDTQTSTKKANVLIEHLVGFHIQDDKFVPLKQDRYEKVYFYDDEPSNIDVANNIQEFLDGYLENSEDEVYNRIIKVIKEKKPTLYTNLITNNSLNRFKTTEIILHEPIKYPIKIQESKILKFKDMFKE
jgi:hypothetical protein